MQNVNTKLRKSQFFIISEIKSVAIKEKHKNSAKIIEMCKTGEDLYMT